MDLAIHSPMPRRKDFRIGILGSGFIVNDCHLVAYRRAGFNPVAIASRTRTHAEKVAARHGITKVYDHYEQLLDDPSLEVLDVAVPPNASVRLARMVNLRGVPSSGIAPSGATNTGSPSAAPDQANDRCVGVAAGLPLS